jgi:hypothetical protein
MDAAPNAGIPSRRREHDHDLVTQQKDEERE